MDKRLNHITAEQGSPAEHQGMLFGPADAGEAEAAAKFLPHPAEDRRRGEEKFVQVGGGGSALGRAYAHTDTAQNIPRAYARTHKHKQTVVG